MKHERIACLDVGTVTKITYSHCTFTNLQKSQCFQAGCCCSFELLEGEAASVCQLLEGMGSLTLQFRSPGGTGDGSSPPGRRVHCLPSFWEVQVLETLGLNFNPLFCCF